MSKIECTAVNELIDLAQKRPLDRDSAADMLFAPLKEANLRRQVSGTPAPIGLFAVELPVEPTEGRATMPKISTRRPQFEPTPRPTPDLDHRAIPRLSQDLRQHAAKLTGAHEDFEQTTDVPRLRRLQKKWDALPEMVRKLALPTGALLMVGIGVGLAVKSHGPAGTPLDYAAAFTPPKIVIAPKPAPPPQAPKLVDVRLESTPSGAMATLLDNTTGSSTPLGSTPVEASIDPTKQYDVRFELDGHRPTTQHLDPATSKKLEVALAEPEPQVEAAPPPPVVAHHRRGRHGAVAAKKAAAKRVATAPAARHSDDPIAALGNAAKTRGAKPGAPDAPGFVSITTSVPCAILLDGANTGKSTPTKLTVPAGHHSIRLIAAAQHVNKQVGVDVTAKKTTRINESF
jgi:hypothetical protein